MTPESQRIAIAEACGWTIETTTHFKVLYPPGLKTYGLCCGLHLSDREVWKAGLKGDENGEYRFPNYLSDLNAMHEAEKVLNDYQSVKYKGAIYSSQRAIFTYILVDILNGDKIGIQWPILGLGVKFVFALVHTTATQRAEAFLRCLNLWKA